MFVFIFKVLGGLDLGLGFFSFNCYGWIDVIM